MVLAIIGAISTLVAGICLKVLEKILGRQKDRDTAARVHRDELRIELDRNLEEKKQLKIDLEVAENQADRWRDRYWRLYDKFFNIRLIAKRLADDDSAVLDEINEIVPPHE